MEFRLIENSLNNRGKNNRNNFFKFFLVNNQFEKNNNDKIDVLVVKLKKSFSFIISFNCF